MWLWKFTKNTYEIDLPKWIGIFFIFNIVDLCHLGEAIECVKEDVRGIYQGTRCQGKNTFILLVLDTIVKNLKEGI